MRYLISEDGLKIIEKRQMHKAIIEFSMAEGVKAGYHTAIMDQVPEDSDVFHVLARTPSVPEYILTKDFVYYIEANGNARYMMTMEAFRKTKTPPNQ